MAKTTWLVIRLICISRELSMRGVECSVVDEARVPSRQSEVRQCEKDGSLRTLTCPYGV